MHTCSVVIHLINTICKQCILINIIIQRRVQNTRIRLNNVISCGMHLELFGIRKTFGMILKPFRIQNR